MRLRLSAVEINNIMLPYEYLTSHVSREVKEPKKQRYGCSIVCFVWKHTGPVEKDEVSKIKVCKSTLEDLADVDDP